MKTILVVDGNSIINRAFYGIRILETKDGKCTNAIYGMLNILLRQLELLKPTYAAVAFDVKAPTFRHNMYDGYKQGRHPTPPELLSQFPDAKECLEAMGFSVLELPGWEADDLQGTVAAMAKGDDSLHAYILSGDKDLLQLIDPSVSVLLAGNQEQTLFDEDAFVAKYGVRPCQFVDVKALMGDSSDNIPGVPGVGEKTALKLIAAFGSLDGVYEALEQGCSDGAPAKLLTPSLRTKLTEGKESAYLSQTLARICCEAPLGRSLESLTYRGVDNDAMYRKCMELELTSIIRKMGLKAPSAPLPADLPAAYGQTEGAEMELLSDDSIFGAPEEDTAAVSEREASLAGTAPVSVDALPTLPEQICLVAGEEGIRVYTEGAEEILLSDGQVAELFDGSHTVLCFDAKALCHRLYAKGISPRARFVDLMLAGYLWRAGDGKSDLPSLTASLLQIEYSDRLSEAKVLTALEPLLIHELEQMGSLSLFRDVECRLAPILAEMEQTGFGLDCEGMEAYGRELLAEQQELTERIYMQVGHPFNLNSPKQLGTVLFEEMGLPTGKKTKSGYSTDAETLERLRFAHPIVADVLAYRQAAKLYSTYAVGLVAAADENGRIHTDFKQAHVATGRLSSAEPNLQNIPVRTKAGEKMRGYFVAKEGHVLVDADYSQIELRLLAELSHDREMLRTFREGVDIHTRTAASVFGVPEVLVTPELRSRAKAVNFGIVYGIGAHSLSIDLGVPQAHAKEYIESYLASYPEVDAYLKQTVEDAAEDGYTTTLYGRRRQIPELKSPKASLRQFGKRVAMNSPIQGTAADIMKMATIRVYDRLAVAVPEARVVMQVHDELIVETPCGTEEKVARILKQEMEQAVSLEVPLLVEVGIGSSWLDAK